MEIIKTETNKIIIEQLKKYCLYLNKLNLLNPNDDIRIAGIFIRTGDPLNTKEMRTEWFTIYCEEDLKNELLKRDKNFFNTKSGINFGINAKGPIGLIMLPINSHQVIIEKIRNLLNLDFVHWNLNDIIISWQYTNLEL